MLSINHTHRRPACCPQPDDAGGAAGVCLDDYQTDVDDTSFTTSAGTPQASGKVLTTPPGFAGGRYQLQFSYVMDPNNNDDFFVQIGIDGAPPANEAWPQDHRELATDDGDGEFYVYAQATCLDLTPGVHTVEIYLWSDGDPHTLRETTIEIWRIDA